jgi:hypothetical protein
MMAVTPLENREQKMNMGEVGFCASSQLAASPRKTFAQVKFDEITQMPVNRKL